MFMSQGLQIQKKMNTFANGIEVWCNGSTTDFGSASSGSSPDISTRNRPLRQDQWPVSLIFSHKARKTQTAKTQAITENCLDYQEGRISQTTD